MAAPTVESMASVESDRAVELSRRLLLAARAGEPAEAIAAGSGLSRIDPALIRGDEARTAFWLNVYNGRLLQSLAAKPRSGHLIRHRRLFRADACDVGGLPYSLDVIEHGLLRGNARPPYSLRRVLRDGDRRLAAAPSEPDPRVHFALNCGARSCPPIRVYSSQRVGRELSEAERAYLGAETSLDRGGCRLELPGVIKLYRADFGSDAELVRAAAEAMGGRDGAWVAERAEDLQVSFARFDWRLEPLVAARTETPGSENR